MVVCAILEKRNIVAKRNVFFVFHPPTNENKIKTLKKSLFRRKFCFYTHMHEYLSKGVLCKMPIILLKTLKNTSFMNLLRKKYIIRIIIIFLLLFCESNDINKKSSKNLLFREMAYISFFLTKKRWSFLDEMLILLKTLKKLLLF